MRKSYSLFSDPNQALSINHKLVNAFRSHLVYLLCTNEKVSFTDNQVLTSRNLRWLLRNDPTFIHCVKAGDFVFLMRSLKQKILSMDEVYQQFEDSNKFDQTILPEGSFHRESQELLLVQNFGQMEAWHYENTANFYSQTVRRVLLGNAGSAHFSTSHQTVLDQLLEQEILRNAPTVEEGVEQIGRVYLNNGLADDLAAEMGTVTEAQRDFINRIADAAYVSNLPRAYALSPVYAPSQVAYFDLIRDAENCEMDEETTQREEIRLTAEFIAGALARFEYEDIAAIRESFAFKRFNEFSEKAAAPVQQRDEIELAFIELRRTIENRIIQRFGKPINSQKSDLTTIKKRWSLAEKSTSEVLSFSVASALKALGGGLIAGPLAAAGGVAAGYFGTFTITRLRERSNQDSSRLQELSAAKRELQLRKICDQISIPGTPKKVEVTETVWAGQNQNEVMVNPTQY